MYFFIYALLLTSLTYSMSESEKSLREDLICEGTSQEIFKKKLEIVKETFPLEKDFINILAENAQLNLDIRTIEQDWKNKFGFNIDQDCMILPSSLPGEERMNLILEIVNSMDCKIKHKELMKKQEEEIKVFDATTGKTLKFLNENKEILETPLYTKNFMFLLTAVHAMREYGHIVALYSKYNIDYYNFDKKFTNQIIDLKKDFEQKSSNKQSLYNIIEQTLQTLK